MRNSNGEVIQKKYGGDGLDPMMMEGDDEPVDFNRVLEHVKAINRFPEEEPQRAAQMLAVLDSALELSDDDKQAKVSDEFVAEMRKFLVSVA